MTDSKLIPATAAAAATACAGAIAYLTHQKVQSAKTTMVNISESDKKCCIESDDIPISYEFYDIDFSMHRENRSKIIERMEKLMQIVCDDEVEKKKLEKIPAIVLHGGVEMNKYDTDTCFHFRQESFFQYLFGVKEPGCAGVIDLKRRESILFFPRLSEEWELWCGKRKALDFYKEHYGVDYVCYVDEMLEILQHRGISYLFRLSGVNSDSGLKTVTTSSFEGIEKFELNDIALYPELVECRVIKTEKELQLLRYVNRISSLAHIDVMKRIRPKMFEFHAESMFLHFCYSQGGARLHAYTCICGSGDGAATLHYGHAGAPNDKMLEAGNFLLNDMGAEYHCYASDITCTFPVGGKFSADQLMIYDGVLKAHDAVINAMKPGVGWKDLHLLSHRVLTEHLLDNGLFQNGTVDELMAHEVSSYFYPHGLGHLMGLDVHDVGGYPRGIERSPERILRKLRCGRVLEENMVLTVEPGCYFIDAQIDECMRNPDLQKFINVELLARYKGTGGVRIESNVIVKRDGAENMTKVPRSTKEIEAVMQHGVFICA